MRDLPTRLGDGRDQRSSPTCEAEIAWEQHTIRIHGRTVPTPRLTAWMGDSAYRYSGLVNEPQPWPPALADLRERLRQELGVDFNSCLANLLPRRSATRWATTPTTSPSSARGR